MGLVSSRATKSNGRHSRGATPTMRDVLRIQSGCTFRRSNSRMTRRPAERRGKSQAIISTIMPASSSTFRALLSVAATTTRPSWSLTALHRRRTNLTNMCPQAALVAAHPHLWLDDEYSLYDMFGFEFTLLRLGAKPPDATPLRAAAQSQVCL